MNIGELIKKKREEKGMQQKYLALTAGIHKSTLSLIESGDRGASLSTLTSIANALGLRLSELLEDFTTNENE